MTLSLWEAWSTLSNTPPSLIAALDAKAAILEACGKGVKTSRVASGILG